MGRNDGNGALFDPSVLFLRPPIPGGCLCKSHSNRFEQSALVPFYLKKVVAAFFDDEPGGLVLVVQCVGGDGFPIKNDLIADQVLGGFKFAFVAFTFFLEQWAMAAGTPVS